MNKNTADRIIVRAVITNKDRVLIVQRSDSESRAGEWEVPGGTIEAGEILEHAIKREVNEETGLSLDGYKYEQSARYKTSDEDRLGVIFTAESDSDKVKLSREHRDYKWIDSSNYNNIKFDEHYQKYFDKLFKTDKNVNNSDSSDVKDTANVEHIIIYTDGGSRGNPGPSASGYVIMNEDEQVLDEGGEYLGITTNNQAEYQAVKLALEMASKFGKPKVDFYIDSLLVVNQMNGIYKIKNRDLWPIHEKIKELAKGFKGVTYTHVRREFNSMADAKVNEVLDTYNHHDN